MSKSARAKLAAAEQRKVGRSAKRRHREQAEQTAKPGALAPQRCRKHKARRESRIFLGRRMALGRPRRLRRVAGGFSTTTSVARLENGDTIVTDSRGSLNPSTRIRDPSMNNSRGTPGGAANGGVDSGEWVPRAAEDSHNPDIPNPHHAERRAIEEAERRGTKIHSISATNNCCPTCRQALRRHNPDIIITDANGNPAPDP